MKTIFSLFAAFSGMFDAFIGILTGRDGRDAACHVSTKTRPISMRLRVVILFCGMFCAANMSAQYSGTFGNLEWSFSDETGTLTISGTGEMPEYSSSLNYPWSQFGSNIRTVIIGDDVTSIGTRAFENNSSLTEVTFGNSIETIGDYAFASCSRLTEVILPNSVLTIGNFAFRYCNSLTEITIPNLVITIGNFAFANCGYLSEVIIGNFVKTIGSSAFSGCSGLTEITIGNSVETIGVSAFYNCRSLTEVIIPNSVITIDANAFGNCSSLTEITIGNLVATIGSSAFSGCSDLTEITIGNFVTTIGSSAFSGCSSLIEFTIGSSVETIGDGALASCTSLTAIIVSDDNMVFSSIDGVLFNKSQTTLIQYPGGKQGGYNIPGSVTTIANRAFSGCTNLIEVTIGNSVERIGNNAFAYCNNLMALIVYDDNKNFSSNDGVLFNKNQTTLIKYPGGKQGGYTIPGIVTTIGNSAFYNCSGLTDISIPNSVITIDTTAFYNCSGLTEIIIPNSVITIAYRAFWLCSGLTEVNISNSVIIIEGFAFSACSNLAEVTIGNSVETIENYAFANCISLTSIFNYATTPQLIDFYVFHGVDAINATLHVPAGSVAAYQAAEVWKDFGKIVEFEIPVITYAVTFDSQGGSAVASQIVEQDGKVTQPANPTSTGYIFSGWYKEASCINEWNFTDELTAAITLYANWTALYTVAFDTQSGNAVASQIVEHDGKITQPADPTRAGYIFSGWYKEANGINAWNFADEVTAMITLYAKWTALHIVNFDTQGGNTIASQIVAQGGKATQPADPTRAGHIFSGWYKDASGSAAWNFTTDAIIDAITLYAKWTVDVGGISTSTAESFIPTLNIYPNPFTGTVQITGAALETRHATSLQIINSAGAVIHTQMITNPDETINLEHLSSGVYLFRFEKDGNIETVRVVRN